MTDTVYETSEPLFVDLLNSAFSYPAAEGFFTYRVETLIVAITYTARPVERDGRGRPTRYAVIDIEHASRHLLP